MTSSGHCQQCTYTDTFIYSRFGLIGIDVALSFTGTQPREQLENICRSIITRRALDLMMKITQFLFMCGRDWINQVEYYLRKVREQVIWGFYLLRKWQTSYIHLKRKSAGKFGGVNHFLQSGIKPEHNFYDHLSFQRCKTVSKMSYTCYSYFITCSLVFFFITCIQPPRRFCVTSSLISHVSKERLEFLISF